METDVGIAGGGCSGVLVAVQLLRQGFQGSITIVEPRPQLGRGLAYSTRFDEHLLNVSAARMSALPDEPSHFVKWLWARGIAGDAERLFAPRALYGEYLGDLLQTEILSSPGSGKVRHVRAEVTAVSEVAGGARLEISEGGALTAGKLVLALGNPASSRNLSPSLLLVDVAIQPSPWFGDTLTLRFPGERILLLGTGLTAVDSMLALLGQEPDSRVHMVSPRGLLPRVHSVCSRTVEFPALSAHRGLASIVREFRGQVSELEASGFCWRVAADALRGVSNPLWSNLTLADRKRFLRHVKTYWEPHRHRMPPEINARLHEYIKTGRLNVVAGRVQRLARENGSIQVFLSAGGLGARTLEVDRIINCTGIHEDFQQSSRPLIRSMIAEGTASANDLGIGFCTDAHGALVNRGSQISGTLFTLGPPRRGGLFETTAVPEIRAQAKALARHLMRS